MSIITFRVVENYWKIAPFEKISKITFSTKCASIFSSYMTMIFHFFVFITEQCMTLIALSCFIKAFLILNRH